MTITEVRIKKVDSGNNLRAIAAITIDGVFVVHEIRVIEGRDGLFIAMPSRKTPNGEHKDVAHPINTETREMIEKVVIEEYNKAIQE